MRKTAEKCEFYYEYDGVYGFILSEYATPERIEAYLDDEEFEEAIKARYKSIDLSGDNEKDLLLIWIR